MKIFGGNTLKQNSATRSKADLRVILFIGTKLRNLNIEK